MTGLKKKNRPQKFFHFDDEEKRAIIEDYLQSGLTKKEIWKKYTGREEEYGTILRRMYEYVYLFYINQECTTFISKDCTMSNPQNHKQESLSDFEHLRSKKRISELGKQLQKSEMKSIAWQTMIKIAE